MLLLEEGINVLIGLLGDQEAIFIVVLGVLYWPMTLYLHEVFHILAVSFNDVLQDDWPKVSTVLVTTLHMYIKVFKKKIDIACIGLRIDAVDRKCFFMFMLFVFAMPWTLQQISGQFVQEWFYKTVRKQLI